MPKESRIAAGWIFKRKTDLINKINTLNDPNMAYESIRYKYSQYRSIEIPVNFKKK